jgi:NADH-quinone oxidoreductase subunit J
MAEVFFFLAAIGALAGALATVLVRNPFYSVLALVCHLISLAALFLLLRAEFVAAAQVIVYAGAVMVLYVFVVAYIGGADQPLRGAGAPSLRWASLLFAGALFVELCIAFLGTGLSILGEEGTGYFAGFGTAAQMGKLFLTDFLLAFEAASLLLLIAAVGAVILARRRTGLEDAREISVSDLMRDPQYKGTLGDAERGTLLEAGGPPHR